MIDVNVGQEDIIDPLQPPSLQGLNEPLDGGFGTHIYHDGYRTGEDPGPDKLFQARERLGEVD